MLYIKWKVFLRPIEWCINEKNKKNRFLKIYEKLKISKIWVILWMTISRWGVIRFVWKFIWVFYTSGATKKLHYLGVYDDSFMLKLASENRSAHGVKNENSCFWTFLYTLTHHTVVRYTKWKLKMRSIEWYQNFGNRLSGFEDMIENVIFQKHENFPKSIIFLSCQKPSQK